MLRIRSQETNRGRSTLLGLFRGGLLAGASADFFLGAAGTLRGGFAALRSAVALAFFAPPNAFSQPEAYFLLAPTRVIDTCTNLTFRSQALIGLGHCSDRTRDVRSDGHLGLLQNRRMVKYRTRSATACVAHCAAGRARDVPAHRLSFL